MRNPIENNWLNIQLYYGNEAFEGKYVHENNAHKS